MGYKEGLENLINRIWVSEEDKKNIGEIQRAGVRVFAQMLPNNAQDPIPQL
jgi:mannose/fructose/N-acetylgalactosamine-specific phosphotransferase system component IIB